MFAPLSVGSFRGCLFIFSVASSPFVLSLLILVLTIGDWDSAVDTWAILFRLLYRERTCFLLPYLLWSIVRWITFAMEFIKALCIEKAYYLLSIRQFIGLLSRIVPRG